MTDKDLKRLSRADLLELLIIERQELDRLMSERSRTLKDFEALNEKLNAIDKELRDAKALLNQHVAYGRRQPNGAIGNYGMPNSMNGRFENGNG